MQLAFMQSDGGLSPVDLFSGHKAILSGPAGGSVFPAASSMQSSHIWHVDGIFCNLEGLISARRLLLAVRHLCSWMAIDL